jgi:hypothetical protein
MQPTPQDIERVTERIETLEAGRFWPEGGLMRLSDNGATWGELTGEQQIGVLISSVDWVGFDAAQIIDVTRRVIEGEAAAFWMDGMGDDPGYEKWRDGFPTSDEWGHLKREQADDTAQRPLHEKGVRYEDEFAAMMQDVAVPKQFEPRTGEVVAEDETRPGDAEEIAERNRIEYGSDLAEDEGIAYHDQLLRDDAARPVPEGMTRLYHGGRSPTEDDRWFSDSIGFAGGNAQRTYGQVYYLDIPADYPLPPADRPDFHYGGMTWGGHLPEELSHQAKPLAHAVDRTDYDRALDAAAARGNPNQEKGRDR